jgi:glycosyltransferase involved in cell wall biosynthesis
VKPLLLVTNHAPPERVEPFRLLCERHGAEVALFGGRLRHGAEGVTGELPFPHRFVEQHDIAALAASGDYRAVIAGTVGRRALPGAWRGARRAGVPFILWSALWAHPKSLAGIAGLPLIRRIYRDADAIVTYGPHVSAYVRRHGARNVHDAPQAVDNEFWSAPATRVVDEVGERLTVLFVGRLAPEKGVPLLLGAWKATGLGTEGARLVLVGEGPERERALASGLAAAPGALPAEEVRNFLAAADVLVVPSIATRSFREPWGLVVNEAMNQGTPVIASNCVGAAAGGLVRHGRNGLVVPGGDRRALALALRRIGEDASLRSRLGSAARDDVRPYTFKSWLEGFTEALATLSPRQEAR